MVLFVGGWVSMGAALSQSVTQCREWVDSGDKARTDGTRRHDQAHKPLGSVWSEIFNDPTVGKSDPRVSFGPQRPESEGRGEGAWYIPVSHSSRPSPPCARVPVWRLTREAYRGGRSAGPNGAREAAGPREGTRGNGATG